MRRARAPIPAKRPVAAKQGYHHLHLRRALLDAAINHLASGDVATLTMQALGRAAKVSPGAPYHHFEDKLAVLAALATEGWARLYEEAQAAVAAAADGPAQLLALARAFLRFTAAHPSHYRVMLLADVGDRTRFAELHATSGRSLALLLAVVSRGAPSLSHELVSGRAVAAWSTLHGFASLRGAGVLSNIPGLPPLAALEEAAAQQTARSAFASVLQPRTKKRTRASGSDSPSR